MTRRAHSVPPTAEPPKKVRSVPPPQPSSQSPTCTNGESESGTLRVADRPPLTAAGAAIDLLCSLGVDTFFGIPGGPVIPVFDAILTRPRATLIEPRQETNGAFAAMGYHRATGKVPALVVTAGPGATNVVTGVVSAHFERVPMIVLCGDVPWTTTGKRLLQDTGVYGIGIERMLAGVTRAVIRITRADAAAGQVRAAVKAALNPENPGPVLVVMSVDWAGSPSNPPALYGGELRGLPSQPRQPSSGGLPERLVLQSVARRLTTALRPLVIVGGGSRNSSDAITRFIDALGAPFVTTPRAKGVVPETHTLSLRTAGMAASHWARRYMRAEPDVTIVFGADLDDVSMAGTPPIGDKGALIHVDTDPSVLGRNYPTEVGLVSDVGETASALVRELEHHNPKQFAGLVKQAKAESPFDAQNFRDDTVTPIAPHRVIADLERAAGPDATFVSDIGEHMLFALHYLTARTPDSFVIHLGLGSMASGIGSAIGLALGNRDRRVVCICGDGGMHMGGNEILVAIKQRLPIVYAVFNDARYNMVYHGYRHTFGREAAWDTPLIDFVAWANALGARAARIDRPGQITTQLLDRLTEGLVPAVLDIRQDASIRIQGDGRLEAVRQMSLIHANK